MAGDFFVVYFIIFFFPTVLALRRNHRVCVVFITNILFGWLVAVAIMLFYYRE